MVERPVFVIFFFSRWSVAVGFDLGDVGAPPLMVSGRVACLNVWESTNGKEKDDSKIKRSTLVVLIASEEHRSHHG